MITQAEYTVGKIWADTDDPIIFLTPQPLRSNGSIKELFRMVQEMSRFVRRKNTSRIFLMLNLKESGGSSPELMAIYFRNQLQFQLSGLPLSVSVVRSDDTLLMESIESEIRRSSSLHASVHNSFEDALRQISYIIKADQADEKQTWVDRFFRFL